MSEHRGTQLPYSLRDMVANPLVSDEQDELLKPPLLPFPPFLTSNKNSVVTEFRCRHVVKGGKYIMDVYVGFSPFPVANEGLYGSPAKNVKILVLTITGENQIYMATHGIYLMNDLWNHSCQVCTRILRVTPKKHEKWKRICGISWKSRDLKSKVMIMIMIIMMMTIM